MEKAYSKILLDCANASWYIQFKSNIQNKYFVKSWSCTYVKGLNSASLFIVNINTDKFRINQLLASVLSKINTV